MLTLLNRPWLCVYEMLAVRVCDINLSAHLVRPLHGKAAKPSPRAAIDTSDTRRPISLRSRSIRGGVADREATPKAPLRWRP